MLPLAPTLTLMYGVMTTGIGPTHKTLVAKLMRATGYSTLNRLYRH